MLRFIKKNKLKFISYFLCAFAMALFTILSFSCKTYAYTIDSNGNLIGDNLFNKNDVFNNYAINSYNGNLISINDTCSSNYIELSYGLSYYNNLVSDWSTTFGIAFYDSNKSFLEGYNSTTTTYNSFEVTNLNVKYVRLSWYNGSESDYFTDINSIMFNSGNSLLPWEPYGIWYSETNYETINNLYDNALSQYNDLALGNNYGYWKYIDYVEFYVDNSNIFVPNTQEQNEWEISDLYNNNILKVGGYFDTFPLTMEPYQSNYNQVISYINFNAYTPSDSFIISFNNCDGCNVVINDDNSNSFTTIISETNYLIDINKIRESVPSFSLYVIEMYITPNNAEQNGVYFANNDYITAYNKGYNVATSNADRKYIPQITDLQNQINSLNNNITDLSNNIDTLRALNNDLQNQINNSYSWQNLFFAFADTPFRVVSNVLGFELFGLNLFATFIGMITVFGVVYLLKKFL